MRVSLNYLGFKIYLFSMMIWLCLKLVWLHVYSDLLFWITLKVLILWHYHHQKHLIGCCGNWINYFWGFEGKLWMVCWYNLLHYCPPQQERYSWFDNLCCVKYLLPYLWCLIFRHWFKQIILFLGWFMFPIISWWIYGFISMYL